MTHKFSPVTKWSHLAMVGGDQWVLPIWTAVNRARDNGKRIEISSELSNLALHVSVRLTMLPRAIDRINVGCRALYQTMATIDPRYVSVRGQQGYAADFDDRKKYDLLLDIDSFLFELNSVCELMQQFFAAVHELAGHPIQEETTGKKLQTVLRQAGQDVDWYRQLDTHRNFFIHEGAPYMAVDLSRASEPRYDLLIMKENLKNFDDPAKFVRLAELDAIVRGFVAAKPVLQEYLISLFADG